MPVTMRYSAALDQTYEESDPQSSSSSSSSSTTSSSNLAVTPIVTATGTNGNGGVVGFESPASPSSHCSPSSLHSRTSSTDSLDDSVGSGGHSRQLSSDSTEFIPTRTVKTNAKPAFNPLQFVKTGAAPLYKKAVQQVKQYEDVRKVKEMVKEEEEAWQSNLDNWKSKRRQISSHTIQRAEEIKQIEEVEHNRQRKKSKTFSEMMEERSKRRPSSVKLPVYNNEDVDDFGDNSFGIKDEGRQEEEEDSSKDSNGLANDTNASSKLNASFESSGSDQVFHDDEEEPTSHSERADSLSREVKSNGIFMETKYDGRNGVNGKDKEGGMNGCNGDTTPSEEYTFEKAIRSYAEYAESRTKTTRTSQSSETGEQTSFASPSSVSIDSSRNDAAGSYRDLNDASEEVRTPTEVVRREGEQLSVVVCLKRGGDCKDFGFTSKSIRGIGNGVFVESVHVGSPAENAGLKVDDEILSINGECTSNRSHSAIVFAIKQAVYTGYLELQIYRYKNTDFIYVHQPSTSGSLVGVKGYRNGTPVESPVRRRETSPKVDVMKRRSLFESSSFQNSDKRLNRRSLDLNNSRFKDKLASFENLENMDQHNMDKLKQTPERDLTFKKKLASFKSMDSLDGGRSDHQLSRPSVESVNVNVKHKLSSYENLNDGHFRHSERTKESPVRERGALFDKWQSFERTKSCDHLDRYGSNEEVVTPVDYDDAVTNVASIEPPIAEVPLFEQRNSDYDSRLKEPIASSVSTMPLSDVCVVEMLDTMPISSIHEVDVEVPMAEETIDVGLAQEVETELGVVEFRSGFELAESLEETPIVGSQPSSPVTTESNIDHLVFGGHCQIDELAMTESWLKHSELTLLKDCERAHRDSESSQLNLAHSKESESVQCDTALAEEFESLHRDVSLSKDSESSDRNPAFSEDFESSHMEPTLTRDSESSQRDLVHSEDFENLHREPTLSKDSENSQLVNFEDVLDDDDLHNVVDSDEDVDIPIRKLVPPKEKPPPPPPDELENNANTKSVSVRRISSTKRIRKEIWRRRSDFLGIDGDGVEDYIEKEIKNVSPPPKMEEFLLEEKQLTEQCLQDQLMKRREQENEYLLPTTPYRAPVPTAALAQKEVNHEDEIARKEREIIEDLEREEQLGRVDLKEMADVSLSERSEEEARIEAERVESEEILRVDEERNLKEREELLSCQEERLRLEKEKLRKEQEDLLREKEAYQKQIEEHQRYNPLTVQHTNPSLLHGSPTNGPASPEPRELRSRLPPPPPPVKPKLPSPRSMEYMDGGHHRHSSLSSSSSIAALQQPIHLQIDDETKPYNSIVSPVPVPHPPVSKSKQVLHALSASPRAKLVDGEQWLAKRKSDNSRNYNQQHWLVQEAEMRRIIEQREIQHQKHHQQQQQRLPTMQLPQTPNSEWPTQTSPKAAPTAIQRQSSNGSSNYVQQLPIGLSHPQLQQASRIRPSVAPPLNTHHTHHHNQHHNNNNNNNHNNIQPIYGQTVGRLLPPPPPPPPTSTTMTNPQHKTSSVAIDCGSAAKSSPERDPQLLSVSGKKKCSHCAQELGRGAAMIIESLQLFYHIQCFQCCVCHVQLGNGTSGADVRVRNQKLHCHNCYSNDEGLKFSKV